jgi:lipoate-protein ligase A
MAIDEAILTLVGEHRSPPTLRFYEWHEPWVSLGSGQSAGDLDPVRMARRGWGTVRRASGGTAVVHQGHLGFAIILPIGDPVWEGDLVASYLRLSAPFQIAFGRFGAVVEAAEPGQNARFVDGAPLLAPRACFGALGPYELIANQRKVIGNSQVRRRHSATQHGVIQVSGDQSELADVIATESTDERKQLGCYLGRRVGSIEAMAGHSVSTVQLADAIVTALVEELDIEISEGTLEDSERKLADELVESKYANPAWTYRR